MKKKLLFTACIMTTMALSAQSVETNFQQFERRLLNRETKAEQKVQFEQKICTQSFSNRKFERKELEGRRVLPLTPKAIPQDTEISALYMLPTDVFHRGLEKTWGSYKPIIILPVNTDAVFFNFSTPKNANFNWSLQNYTAEEFFIEEIAKHFKVLPELNSSYSTRWPASFTGYMYQLSPVITATSGGNSDSYFYTKGATYQNQSIENNQIGFPSGYFTFSKVDPLIGGIYVGFSVQYESGEIENKKFGSGQKNSQNEECTGIITAYSKPSTPLVIESVSIHAVPNTPKDENAVTVDDLSLKVYEINKDGQLTNNELANAKCESVEYIKEADSYYITFQFTKDQGLLGTQPTPFVLNQNAAFEIDGFDKCDVTVLVARNENGTLGSAFGVYPSGLDYIGYNWYNGITGTEDYNIADFHMNLNAAYVTLSSATGEPFSLTAPTEGGVITDGENNAFAMFSTFPFTDPDTEEDNIKIVESPEWVKIGIDNSPWGTEDGGFMFLFQVTCDPLVGEGREGDIVFESIGGIQNKVHITQGKVTGIENIEANLVKAIANGDNFELTYSESITNVTVNNVAGQTLATYELPAGGKYLMPAADLAKGMYILKFSNNQTIKVIK